MGMWRWCNSRLGRQSVSMSGVSIFGPWSMRRWDNGWPSILARPLPAGGQLSQSVISWAPGSLLGALSAHGGRARSVEVV
jgi:hypothetical protein